MTLTPPETSEVQAIAEGERSILLPPGSVPPRLRASVPQLPQSSQSSIEGVVPVLCVDDDPLSPLFTAGFRVALQRVLGPVVTA